MVPAVVTGATCMCSFGTTPANINVTSQMTVTVCGKPVATIQDNGPANIAGFGMCSAPSNPAVAAAMGVPQPCKYMQAGTWIPKQTQKLISGTPILTGDATCMCNWAGVVSIANPGQTNFLL